ncbi:MAG: MBL fold metallo-hydrolase, partial [Burkholderiaceae bacterium]
MHAPKNGAARQSKRIEVLRAVHTVPAVGFAVDGGACEASGQPRGWWVYTGDTGPNPLLWQRLRRMKVAHLVIETAFSDEERQLARISRHLCPAAYFSDRGRSFQSDRGRHFSLITDGRGGARKRGVQCSSIVRDQP